MTKVVAGSPVWSLNGVNTFSESLVRGLAASGYDASILLTGATYRERKPLPFPNDVRIEQLRIPVVATWKRRWQALVEYLESEAPCIYIPNYDFRHSCVTSALSPRVGVVGIVHSDDPQHYEHARRMGTSWNAAVAVSRKIAHSLSGFAALPADRLVTIPYGIDAAPHLPPRPATGRIDLIYTGRLEQDQKRVHDLVLIAEELRRRKLDFSLTIVGNGPERGPLLRSIADRGLSQHVRIHDSVSNRDVLHMCANSDGFLLTSAYEGMPVSLLEAMGQGCIPFTTAIESGVPEIVVDGRNGCIVQLGDIEGFANRIGEIAASPDTRARIRSEAWRTVATGPYTTASMIASYRRLIDSVAMEVDAGTFQRSGKISPVDLSLDERIAAPLWAFRPDLRKQLAPRQ